VAILVDYTYKGVTITDAYLRIGRITGGKHTAGETSPRNRGANANLEGAWHARVDAYASQAMAPAYDAMFAESALLPEASPALESFDIFAPYVANENPYTALYAALKLTPEFSNVRDS